jgi:hypothetical protein
MLSEWQVEEFFERSGRLMNDGYSRKAADDLTVFRMLGAYRNARFEDFAPLRAIEPQRLTAEQGGGE